MWQLGLAAFLAVVVLAVPVKAEVSKASFGKTADGAEVEQYTLKNKNGMTVKLMTLGATITEISVPDKDGKFANVAFGFDDVAGYQSDRNQYFGCTTGRVANRINKGLFTLDGHSYKLAINNGPNHLHGGTKRSLDKVVWKESLAKVPVPGGSSKQPHILLEYESPSGEEGYPGKLLIYVKYTLNDKNELTIGYLALTDKATPVNLTNHTYFNLAGAGADTALDHELLIPSTKYIPTNDTLIPTGKIAPVKGTVFDFTKMTRIGDRIDKLVDTGAKGYDLCYVLKPGKTPSLAAKMRDPKSGRVLTVLTTEPGIQFYTGNHLFGQKGKDGKVYKKNSGICLETMGYPDAVNHDNFPSIILRPGATYRQACIYAFSVEK